MNKIIDFKSNSNFSKGGPKFSLCLESSGLTCQIPNVYKTFCDGFVDPTKNPQLNIDIDHIKSYLIGTLASPDPFDVIINNYGSIVSSQFKTDFDPCQNFIVNDIRTDEGFNIITKTIDFMKQVCGFTGYDTIDLVKVGLTFDLILDPRTLNLKKKSDICLLDTDIKNKLRLCCMIYIISNSKQILKSNGQLLNKSFYEVILYFSQLLVNIVDVLSNILNANINPDIRDKLNIYCGYHKLASLFFKLTSWGLEIPNILLDYNDNIDLGGRINDSSPEAFGTGFYVPHNMFGTPLKWFTTCPKEFLATAICHEIGHALKDLTSPPINKYKQIVNNISAKWNLNKATFNNSQISFDEIYNELFCDLIGVEWLENYLFNTPQNSALTDDQKYNIIRNSFAWNCEYPKSSIEQGHPHHSFRINLLLLSKKIHNFLCSYSNPNLVKFIPTSNPACKNDGEYLSQSEYYSKYLKYKNKYLALKKLTNQ